MGRTLKVLMVASEEPSKMCRAVWRLLRQTASPGLQLQFFLLLLQFLQCANASGFFELQILEMSNYRNELENGGCCGAAPRPTPQSPCPVPCRTRFALCLKEYQTNVTSGHCSFGNSSSSVMGTGSFTLRDPAEGSMVLPFTFRWTRSFTLILQAIDDYNLTEPDETNLIKTASYSGIIEPSAEWHTLKGGAGVTMGGARMTYRVRVRCDLNYYNATCTKFCRPRDDHFGHYACNKDGDKQCLAGWQGDTCETAVCKTGCHPVHGKCNRSGECECRPGWQGEFCDQCLPYPGCKHGYCNGSSWQCICDTNWGGILCDQDLNYCGTHEPCLHGGTCENRAPDQYRCTCAEGFSGASCEVVDNPCATMPCAHGGSCSDTEVEGGFSCACSPGWEGETCEVDTDECLSAPCQNGGTCVDLENGFQCKCSSAWEGDLCQFDADECVRSPCVNAVSCVNMVGGYACRCLPGWSGDDCERNIDDCVGQCLHGATCIDLVGDYHCACQPGYTGRDCATDIDDCASRPCRNGGECVDQVNAYRCICPVGYTGFHCEDDRDYCEPAPCANGAPCYSTQGDYYCHCLPGWRGKNCSLPGPPCPHPPCQDINDCAYNPCQNGGTCVDKLDSFQCICREGWEGELCNINIDECSLNPCHNNGSCIDGVADFTCTCSDGWKGKTCSLKDSHCDYSTCRNGGTCQDLGSTFVCRCPPQWGGTACHIAKMPPCMSNPCKNGATCVNTGDYYRCICREGFEGEHCQNDINECASQPCYNGGKCVDGVNWFLCECAAGFGGPDCRINVNECASSPCARQATCLDHIAGYRCLCPPGRAGPTCHDLSTDAEVGAWEESVGGAVMVGDSAGACVWRGQYFAANTTWQWHCNTCACGPAGATCTRLWCGLPNCLAQPPATAQPCHANEVCVPVGSCLSAPCPAAGECRAVEGKRVAPPPLPAPPTCWPNQAVVSSSCARLTLVVERGRASRGASAERLCGSLRRALAAAAPALAAAHRLVLLCDLKIPYNDTVEVTVSSMDEGDSHAIQESVRILGEYVSRKQTNFSTLTAVVEVKVETAFLTQEKQSNGYMIALVCIVLLLMACSGCVVAFYIHQKRRSRSMSGLALSGSNGDPCRHHDDEKSNNLQNEENFRRYANPLKEDAGASSVVCMKAAPQVPLPSLPGLAASANDLCKLRPLSESCVDRVESMHILSNPSTSQDKHSHRGSQILLFKAQNSDARNNTAAALDEAAIHKDFNKRVINMNVLPGASSAHVASALRTPRECDSTLGSTEVLTVLV